MKNNKLFWPLKIVEVCIILSELVLLFIPNAVTLKLVNDSSETIYQSHSFFDGMIFGYGYIALILLIFVIFANVIIEILSFIIKKDFFTMVNMILQLLIVLLIRFHTYFMGNDLFTPILIALMALGLFGAIIGFFLYKIVYTDENVKMVK
jgi:hypothetical protein